MTIFDRLIRFIKQLDSRELYQFIGSVLAVIALVLAFFCYRYYRNISELQKRMRHINQQRVATQTILTQYEQVMHQQKKVDAILKRDQNFKIKQFFIDTLQGLGMIGAMGKDPEVSSQDLVTGYIENRMEVRFSAITMQQLTELLHALEQNERVYIKEIRINSVPAKQAIDVALVVATFEATGSMT